MITYVNNVLVGTGKGVATDKQTNSKFDLNKTIAEAAEGEFLVDSTSADGKVRIGIKTEKGVKWAAPIQKGDVRSIVKSDWFKSTEDVVVITLPSAAFAADANGDCKFAGRRIVVRLTFKDLPTRFRKWTESYEYLVQATDTEETVATAIEKIINEKNANRARVIAKAEGAAVTLTAMEYTDDDSVDTINVANKIRFSANMWYTDPQAPGFASKNKYFIPGATVEKTPGEEYTASWKLVRDMEAQAMGYEGILNRGECTWPIIKPEMNVVKGEKYDCLTIMFENTYRTADDLQRKTKQCINIYGVHAESGAEITSIANKIQTALGLTVNEIAKNAAVEQHSDDNHPKE